MHALLGENGAGKTTLTRIIYGLSQPDSGELRIGGTATRITSPKEAMAAGLGVVTQEFSLVGPMTVTENVMLARSDSPLSIDGRRAPPSRRLPPGSVCASIPMLGSSGCRSANASGSRSSRRCTTTAGC